MDFVNSRFSDHLGSGHIYDRLEMGAWWGWLFERWGLDGARPPTGEAVAEYKRLRSLIRRVLESSAPPTARDIAALNRVLAAAPLIRTLHLSSGALVMDLVPGAVADWVPAAIVESLHEMLSAAGADRVRECANPGCSFLFLDRSPTSRRRWCDPAICGNLLKVRAFRASHGVRT